MLTVVEGNDHSYGHSRLGYAGTRTFLREEAASGANSNVNGNMNTNERNPGNQGSGRGELQDNHRFLRPVARQMARNFVKPLHPATLALPTPFSNTFTSGGAGENAQLQPWSESTESRNNGGEGGASILTLSEAAVANECLVSLLAVHGTTSRLATFAQLTAALKREGFPDAGASLVLLKDVREE
eukprot:g8908.t2